MNDAQKIVYRYMNMQNGKALEAKMKENIDAVISEIKLLPKTIGIRDYISKYDRACKIMNAVAEKKYTVMYSTSKGGNTPRLHGSGESIVQFPRAIRKVLCKGWSEVDLKSSQFAIIAECINAPISKRFIERGGDIWQTLHGGTKPTPNIKAIYKTCLYGICFGMGDSKLEKILESANLLHVLKNDIISELLSLRAVWYNTIKEQGGEFDCWGEWTPLTRDRWEGSVGATIIQSIEMDIAKEMIVFAYKNPDMRITLWLHDGCVIDFTNQDKKDELFDEMSNAVSSFARKQYNTTIRLERTDL